MNFIEAVKNIHESGKEDFEKHREYLKLFADKGLRYSRSIHESKEEWAKNYTDDKFIHSPNLIERLPNVLIIEFDELENGLKPSEALEKAEKVIKKRGWGYFRSSHKGKCDYLWLEFSSSISEDEAKRFLCWICPKNARIDVNFSSPIKVFPVLFAPHRKHPHNEEPVYFYDGEKINFKSLKIPKNILERGKNETEDKEGYKYKTFSVEEEKPIDISKFKPLNIEELKKSLGLTIKKDDINKIITFEAQLSAYTEESQLNLSNNAPSSTGKSYIPMEIAELFPEEDVIIVGYCSPTAFFHDVGSWDKERKTYLVDLERKILIFLDQPHTLLLQHLRPLLSHDRKEIQLKITDKSQKHGLRTKNVIVRGYPSVIFCTAGLKIDEQEATRFILLSPETTQEKIREGIMLKIKKDSDKDKFKAFLNANPERRLLKDRIKAIKREKIKEIVIPEDIKEKLTKKFFDGISVLKPRHQRDIGRVIAFVKISALLNVWFRERGKDDNSIIYVCGDDLEEGFKIWDEIRESQELNLPPFVYNVFREVILPCYERKKEGLTRNDILKGYFEIYGRALQDWMLRQQIVPMLENAGLISQEKDINDKRKILIHPTPSLTIVSTQKNNSELDRGVVKTNENNSEQEGGGLQHIEVIKIK